MIGWMGKNSISREAIAVLKIYKSITKLYNQYCTHTRTPVSRDASWSITLRLEGIKRVTKIIKGVKNYRGD